MISLKNFIKKIIKIIIYLIWKPLSFIIGILVYLISPIILIRFGEIPAGRLGHLSGNMEIYFSEKNNNNFSLDIFNKSYKTSNTNLYNRIKKKVKYVYPEWIIQPTFRTLISDSKQ